MNYRDRIAQKIQEKENNLISSSAEEITDNVEPFESSDFFGVENIRNHPTCVDLRLSDGTFRAIPYPYINDIIYNPAEGIEIFTPTKKVVVTGRNLKLLYNYLTAYRVKYIASNIGNDLSEEKKLFVKQITIEEL